MQVGSSSEHKRRRAKHSKTRLGCTRCKQRHIKCDEAKPACARCVQAGLSCPGFEEAPSTAKRTSVKRFRIIQCATDAAGSLNDDDIIVDEHEDDTGFNYAVPPGHIASAATATASIATDPRSSASSRHQTPDSSVVPFLHSVSPSSFAFEQTAVDFFLNRTLTTIHFFCPCSDLWTPAVFAEFVVDPKIRNIAVAIGLCHQTQSIELEIKNHQQSGRLTASHASQHPSFTTSEVWDDYYNKALGFTSTDLSNTPQSAARDLNIALTCLLCVIYLSLQNRYDEAAVHMNSGLSIINEEGEQFLSAGRFHQEVYLLFLHLGTSSWPGHPSKHLYDLLQATIALKSHLSNLSPLQSLRAEMDFLVSKIYQFAAAVTKAVFITPADANAARDALLKECDGIGAQLDVYAEEANVSHLPSPSNNPPRIDTMWTKSFHARLMLYKIFTRSVVSRYQTTYDRYEQTFEEATTALESALLRARALSGIDWPLFSLQFSVISTLRHIVLFCRNPLIRRRAQSLLLISPQREGVLDAIDAYRIGDIVFEFEESTLQDVPVEKRSYHLIPEENRVHSLERLKPNEPSAVQTEISVRLLYRPDGDSGYVNRVIKVPKYVNR